MPLPIGRRLLPPQRPGRRRRLHSSIAQLAWCGPRCPPRQWNSRIGPHRDHIFALSLHGASNYPFHEDRLFGHPATRRHQCAANLHALAPALQEAFDRHHPDLVLKYRGRHGQAGKLALSMEAAASAANSCGLSQTPTRCGLCDGRWVFRRRAPHCRGPHADLSGSPGHLHLSRAHFEPPSSKWPVISALACKYAALSLVLGT